MEVYDELASCSSAEEDSYDEADALYEPSPVRRKVRHAMVTSQKSSSDDEENKNQHCLDLLKDGDNGKKVTLEQCKDYLRKHGLKLSGTKAVLIERIKGHLQGLETSVDSHPGVSKDSKDPIHDTLVENFSNMDLNHLNNAAMAELLKDVKKVTVEDCKSYLRKHGLRLAGTKQVLLDRIQEHLQIKDDHGLTKYPETSFTIDCQGDACVGDVVLFKQKVYDSFNIGGRCSTGPPVGIRTIAGRVVKESYGSAKQQHTFTVEVLWSTGDRPLPPLHPLIIKGRNLYRVKTLRQRWADETARTKQLQDKHARGAAAREERRARMERVKHLGSFKNQTHRSAPLLGGLSETESRKEKTAIENPPLLNGGSKAVPTYCNGHARLHETVCTSRVSTHAEMGGSIFAIKADPFCRTSVSSLSAKPVADPSCQDCVYAHEAKVDPSRLNSTAVYANQNVNTNIIHMRSSNVEPLCRTTHNVEGAVSAIELRFNSTLAGLIIGKEGTHCKEAMRISQAEINVEIDAANSAVCIVRITGTADQREVASQIVSQRTRCKFFANNGKCKWGEACKFTHSQLGS